jgi:hypothetical protein
MLNGLRILVIVLRPRGKLPEAHGPQFATDGCLARRNAERVPEPLHQIDQPPANHPVQIGLRSGLDRSRQRRALSGVQRGRFARRLAVDQTLRSFGVEAHHPVAHDLQAHAANPRRLGPRSALVDHRQRQQPPDLFRVPAAPRQPPQVLPTEIPSKPDRRRHGKPPRFPS